MWLCLWNHRSSSPSRGRNWLHTVLSVGGCVCRAVFLRQSPVEVHCSESSFLCWASSALWEARDILNLEKKQAAPKLLEWGRAVVRVLGTKHTWLKISLRLLTNKHRNDLGWGMGTVFKHPSRCLYHPSRNSWQCSVSVPLITAKCYFVTLGWAAESAFLCMVVL